MLQDNSFTRNRQESSEFELEMNCSKTESIQYQAFLLSRVLQCILGIQICYYILNDFLDVCELQPFIIIYYYYTTGIMA